MGGRIVKSEHLLLCLALVTNYIVKACNDLKLAMNELDKAWIVESGGLYLFYIDPKSHKFSTTLSNKCNKSNAKARIISKFYNDHYKKV